MRESVRPAASLHSTVPRNARPKMSYAMELMLQLEALVNHAGTEMDVVVFLSRIALDIIFRQATSAKLQDRGGAWHYSPCTRTYP